MGSIINMISKTMYKGLCLNLVKWMTQILVVCGGFNRINVVNTECGSAARNHLSCSEMFYVLSSRGDGCQPTDVFLVSNFKSNKFYFYTLCAA